MTENEPGPQAHDHHIVGSVADEAARLVELLSARHPGPAPSDRTDAPTSGTAWLGAGWPGFGGPNPAGPDPAGPDSADQTNRPGPRGECTCGGRAPACKVCPVCQVISFVSAISPETFDRAADLIDLAATALRDLATAQRERASQAPSAGTEREPHDPDGKGSH